MAVQLIISDRERVRKPRTPVSLIRLAHQTGYSKNHLSQVFSRKKNPSVKCLEAVAGALELTMDEMWRRIVERRVNVTKGSQGERG